MLRNDRDTLVTFVSSFRPSSSPDDENCLPLARDLWAELPDYVVNTTLAPLILSWTIRSPTNLREKQVPDMEPINREGKLRCIVEK